ncbi:MAG: hypothetical protein MJ178_01390 [Treponemataceae bacterium]|nr:hypothetical protein [Treponemataceae bacterium]
MKTNCKKHTGRILCILAGMTLFAGSTGAFAQGVHKAELESLVTNPDTISFVNYTGPHAVISTAAQIRGIGAEMAEPVASDTGVTMQTGDARRYTTYHVIGAADGSKLDADVLMLGENAGVDHIRNLRRIIAGYLTSAYGYTADDADTLAVFITVYNAVNRGKLSAYEQRYKSEVCELLAAEKCGLSVNWEDWAGKTQIVIPLLTPVDGGLSTIDTTTISGKDVVSNLREEDDRGVEERKKLVDLKEREADAAYEEAKRAQIESVQAAEEARQAEHEVVVNREALVAARDAERLALADDDIPAAMEASKAADEAQAEYEASKEKAAAAKEKSAEKAAEAAEKQQFADKKNAETQGERLAIAQDQQKNMQEAAEAKKMKTTYALLFDGKTETSSLLLVNADTGSVVKKSAVTDIRSKCVYPVDGGYIAVAGRNDKKNTAVKLVIIDMDSMELISQSNEDLSPQSVLVEYKNRYYGILLEGKKAYVGCWDDALTLVARSKTTVLEKTPVLITDKGVTVTTDGGAVALLTVDTLEDIK